MMTWFSNISKKSMIGPPASADVHLCFLLQVDIKELAFLEIHFNVLKHVFIFTDEQIQPEKNNLRARVRAYARACVCVCVMVDGHVLALTCRKDCFDPQQLSDEPLHWLQ